MKLHALSHSTHAYPKPLPGDPGATGCAGGGSAASSPPESENNRVESCMPHCRERGEGGRE